MQWWTLSICGASTLFFAYFYKHTRFSRFRMTPLTVTASQGYEGPTAMYTVPLCAATACRCRALTARRFAHPITANRFVSALSSPFATPPPSCVDEWLARQGVCPICKSVVTVSADAAAAANSNNDNITSDDGGAPRRINRPRLAPIVPVDLARAMAALMTPRASTGVLVTGGSSVGGGGGGGGVSLRRPGTPQSLDSGHGTRTAMRAMTAATGGGGGGVSGSGSNVGVDTRILHRVAVTATPTGSSSSSSSRRGWGHSNSTNRDARRMNRGFTSAAGGAAPATNHRRGGAAAGPRGVPASSAEGGGRVGARARGARGRVVRVWESATGDEESDDSGGDGGDERVVTHYENPLFSHRTVVLGRREEQYR